MIKVYSTTNVLEANLIGSELRSHGIRFSMNNYNMITLEVGPYAPYIAIEIYISEKDYESNKNLIDAIVSK